MLRIHTCLHDVCLSIDVCHSDDTLCQPSMPKSPSPPCTDFFCNQVNFSARVEMRLTLKLKSTQMLTVQRHASSTLYYSLCCVIVDMTLILHFQTKNGFVFLSQLIMKNSVTCVQNSVMKMMKNMMS